MAKDKQAEHADVADVADVATGQGGLVKVQANYGVRDKTITLWGVGFVAVDDAYFAELSEADAQALIDAGRVTKV